MSPSRRHTDDEDTDHTSRRRLVQLNLNGHTKWAVGIVSTAVVALAIWGVQADRKRVEDRLSEGKAERVEMQKAITELAKLQAVSATETSAFRLNVTEKLGEIDKKVEKFDDKLDLLRAQYRSARP